MIDIEFREAPAPKLKLIPVPPAASPSLIISPAPFDNRIPDVELSYKLSDAVRLNTVLPEKLVTFDILLLHKSSGLVPTIE